MRSLRTILLLAALPGGTLLAQSEPPAVQERGVGCSSSTVTIRLFPLEFMSNVDAATLLSPFIPSSPYCGVFSAGAAVRGVTVKAPKDVMARVDSLLQAHDRAPTSTVLRFQLIAALDSTIRDAAIPNDVDATLRDLFRFGGYRVLAQGTATVGSSSFEVTMGAGNERYTLMGSLSESHGSGGRGRAGTPTERIVIPGSVKSSVYITVSLRGPVENFTASGQNAGMTYQSLLSTGVSVPMGETVVLGSAAASTSARRALILTVRPEPLGATPKR